MRNKVVAAMSGGVDSAVAAFLLKQQGFDVIGVTLRLAPDLPGEKVLRVGRCCSIDDMVDARQVCDKIGIPFYAIDAQSKFKEAVFDPFIRAYQNGITPIPCLACNHTVKFGDLFSTAQSLEAALATGHYARRVDYKGVPSIAKPFDIDRDQSYYLYGTKREVLSELYFPLGELKKPEVRSIAKEIGLVVHDKKDSHEICFVPDGDHGKVIERVSKTVKGGKVKDEEGREIGEHGGIHRFTVGQRRGLGISSSDRLFVADIDAKTNDVVLAKKSALAVRNVQISDVKEMVPKELWPSEVMVKIRARSPVEKAQVIKAQSSDNTLHLEFERDQFAVALGQAAVIYDGDVVLGGGILSGRLDGMFARTISI